jgi:tetratricopeptide (TPR) repeat protein
MKLQPILSWSKQLILAAGILFLSCAHDTYQQRADLIKDHSEAFYTHLKANRVEAAIRENEQIEAMASEMGQTVKKRASQQGTTIAEREFALMKTAREASATNWLALGQYFAIKKQYPQARATYERVLNTYNNPTDRQYREQAARALEDLNILYPPTTPVTNP